MSEERNDFEPAPEPPKPWDKDDWDGTIISAEFGQPFGSNWALILKSQPDDGSEVFEHKAIGVG